MAGDEKHIIVDGDMRIVEYAVCSDGSMPAAVFVNSLDRKDQAMLFKFFQHLANAGERGFRNTERFKQERGELYTFRHTTRLGPKHGVQRLRLPCFRFDNRWIITHGFWKPPQSKWPEEQFIRAFAIQKDVVTREKKKKQKEKQA